MKIKKLIAPSNEYEIKKHWIYTDRVYISSICFTFNQIGYIRDTIDSFLAQETEYRFEVIIHDDASTDGSRDILLEYKNRYPTIIKLILQEENQYSQGKQIIPLGVEQADGEYIALCEGDDFWIDKNKLQKQIISIKDVDLVITSGLIIKGDEIISDCFNHNQTYIDTNYIFNYRSQLAPTASYFFKKKVISNLPDWIVYAPYSDFLIEIYGSLDEKILFISDKTCVYRLGSVGSWTNQHNDILKREKLLLKVLLMLNFLLLELDSTYSKSIKNRMAMAYMDHAKFLSKNNKKILAVKNILRSWCFKFNIDSISLKIIISLLVYFKCNNQK